MRKNRKIIIAPIVATNAAGKTDISNALGAMFGIKPYPVRPYIMKRFMDFYLRHPVSQTEFGSFANDLRKEHCPEIIIRDIFEKNFLEATPGIHIIESIRCPGELLFAEEWCNQHPHAVYKPIAINAPQQMRYDRMRRREKDFRTPQNYEHFLQNEMEEFEQEEPWQMNIKKCLDMIHGKAHFQNLDGNLDGTVRKIRNYVLK